MEKTTKTKQNRDGSQHPIKTSNDGKGRQVLVDVPTATGVSMDFAQNMKSAAVELKRMSLTNSQSAELLHGHHRSPSLPERQLQESEDLERQARPSEPLQMQHSAQQQQQRPPASLQPEHQAQQQNNPAPDGRCPTAVMENFEFGSSNGFPRPALNEMVKVPQRKEQQFKQSLQFQGHVAVASSHGQTNGYCGSQVPTRPPNFVASPYRNFNLHGFADVGAVLDGMTCPSCGNVKGMERIDLCQLRDAAEELRAQLADLSLQFAQEQNREAAECRRLRGLLEGDAKYKDEVNASRKNQKMNQGSNLEVMELKSELSELKRQFRSQVAHLREQLSTEEMESQKLRDKLQREEMGHGR